MEYIKIISGVLAIFIGYHKFILSLLDRKIDKEIWEREKKLLERLEEENRRNMVDEKVPFVFAFPAVAGGCFYLL